MTDHSIADNADTGSAQVVVLLFDQLPTIDADVLKREIARVDPQHRPTNIHLQMVTNTPEGIYGSVNFGEHHIRLVGFDAPYPASELAAFLQPAHLRPDQKESLKAHKSHIICYYEGEDTTGVEMFIALYKLAYALREQSLRGVVNTMTWMCQTADMLSDVMTTDFLQLFRESPAGSLAFWLGYVKFFRPDNSVWFATKGSPIFGVPDLAYLGKNVIEGEEAYDFFTGIFTYMFQSGKQIAPGHTMQFNDNVYLRARSVYEYDDYLGEQTLVLEKIHPSEINQ